MIQLLSLLKKLLKGDIHIDVDEGVFTYKGVRVVTIPVPAVVLTALEVANMFGDAGPILLERLGEGVGASIKETMGWASGEETLKEFPNIARAGGFGKVWVKENHLVMENLPVSLEDNVLLAYMRGFLRGLCIELEDVQTSGNILRAKFKTVC
ncbi:MAG: hypothetical protein ACK4SY_00365 [Pyrobaculum sp.]